jgi:AcrR family transcriptional regulator
VEAALRTDAPSRAARLPAAERRQALIDAARQAFARHGYHGTGTADIARVCGCSEPVLYRHFAGKRELFAAVLEHCAATTVAALPDPTTSDDPLGDMANRAAAIYRDPKWAELSQLRLLAISLADDPEIGAALRRILEKMHATMASAVRRGQELGHARPDVDPDRIAWLWIGLGMGSSVRQALYDDSTLAETPTIARQLLSLIATEDRPLA